MLSELMHMTNIELSMWTLNNNKEVYYFMVIDNSSCCIVL